MENFSARQILQAHLERTGESVTVFAARSGVHFTVLYRILNGQTEGSVRTLRRIASAVERSGFNNAAQHEVAETPHPNTPCRTTRQRPCA
jgi:predicted transcriptional regulator